MTWDNYGTAWVIDHIIPVTSFKNLDTDELERFQMNHWSNLALYGRRRMRGRMMRNLSALTGGDDDDDDEDTASSDEADADVRSTKKRNEPPSADNQRSPRFKIALQSRTRCHLSSTSTRRQDPRVLMYVCR